MATPSTEAQKFLADSWPYLFQDAHYLVEAHASLIATEIAPNQFRFADGSVLHIEDHAARVYPPAR
jgi:hypothetical protein